MLERALYEATLAELAEVGYGGLTMEGIAARAQTGKAALYRRWDTKCELVQAALVFALPPLPEPRPADRPERTCWRCSAAHRDLLAGKTAFPGLDIIHSCCTNPRCGPSSPMPWSAAPANRRIDPAGRRSTDGDTRPGNESSHRSPRGVGPRSDQPALPARTGAAEPAASWR